MYGPYRRSGGGGKMHIHVSPSFSLSVSLSLSLSLASSLYLCLRILQICLRFVPIAMTYAWAQGQTPCLPLSACSCLKIVSKNKPE